MADIASITRTTPTGRPGSIAANGQIIVTRGTFPTTAATATVPVGDLSSADIVLVHTTEAKASHTIPIVEVVASRTVGAQGVVTIGTQDGSNTPSTITVEVVKIKI